MKKREWEEKRKRSAPYEILLFCFILEKKKEEKKGEANWPPDSLLKVLFSDFLLCLLFYLAVDVLSRPEKILIDVHVLGHCLGNQA